MTNEELAVLAQNGDDEAGSQLFKQNERFIHGQCQKYLNLAEYDELFGFLSIGFVEAIKSYKAEKGVKFLSFAGAVMRNSLLQRFRSGNSKMKYESIDTTVVASSSDDSEVYLIDMLKSEDTPAVDLMMEDETSLELQNYLKAACKTERELNVAEMYFNGGMTQRDISIVIGVSQSHVHRTIKKVIARIQQSFKYLDYQTA